jgi:hypothetical protein
MPLKYNTNDKKKAQSGQTVVEFVLLMFVILAISLGFLKVINTNLAKMWKNAAIFIVNDPSQNSKLDL